MDQKSIDRVSLEQTLIDFEVANARVIDLTERLTSMGKELHEAKSAHHELHAIQASRAFKLVRFLGRISRKLRGR
jgi:hypothetical protein